jgi:hypothetical protein
MSMTDTDLIGYSVERARHRFDPPLPHRALRKAIDCGELVSHSVGRRSVVLDRDLEEWIANRPATKSPGGNYGR